MLFVTPILTPWKNSDSPYSLLLLLLLLPSTAFIELYILSKVVKDQHKSAEL